MQKNFRKFAKISLILVYLVIAAGAIVRMTGSGMGCPDWPKCFGYYIPPTDVSELQWMPDKQYKKGQVIIKEESLQVAKEDFMTAGTFDAQRWEPYTKHDYALFNPWHTWIEFLNRLLGALAGLATLMLAILSFRYWKKEKIVTLLSVLVVFAMGFQAWLGATVVYSVLEPVKITVHMVMALIIVAMLLVLIFKTREKANAPTHDPAFMKLILLALGATLVQIILGTQVRQFVDEQIGLVGETAKNLWLRAPNLPFYIHRSFSVLVLLLNVYLGYRVFKKKLDHGKIYWVLALLGLEVLTGVLMYYLDFPFSTQPIHLILASLLFGAQFYLVMEAINTRKSPKTS